MDINEKMRALENGHVVEVTENDLQTCKECGSEDFGVVAMFFSMRLSSNAVLVYCQDCEYQIEVEVK